MKQKKKYVVENLRPLLKQNRMTDAREMLVTDIDNDRITFEEYINIASFLLFHLQDNYFNGGDYINSNEFEKFDILHIDIPSWVTDIADSAFLQCRKLESVSIPDGVTEIEETTFWKCESLKKVIIPKSVTQIGDSAFKYCTSLRSITIPKNCKLCDYAFDDDVEIIRR